jgi:hypothetical protein
MPELSDAADVDRIDLFALDEALKRLGVDGEKEGRARGDAPDPGRGRGQRIPRQRCL